MRPFAGSAILIRPLMFLRCLFFRGHEWTNSKAKKGYMTCRRCRMRKRWR